MGIKDNFQQALRELTGTEKEDAKRGSSVDAIKNAVSAGDGSEYDTVGGSSYDEIQKRAAAAADEMTRQQSAYLDVTYHNDDGGRAGAETDQGDMTMGLPESGESTEPLRISGFENNTAGRTAAGTPAGDPARPSRNADPYENQAPRSASDPYAGSPYSAGNQNAGAQRSANPYGGGQYAGSQYGGQQQRAGAPSGMSSENPRGQTFSAARYDRNTGSEDNEITVISKNTVIDGNVRSFANMSIDGNVKGNVETTKDIDLNGKIVGNIACNNAQMRVSQIQGNVQLKGNVYMERDTLLIGDLSSNFADINGKIKGNVAITGKAELRSDAVIFGDISASTITVNDGAIIQGYVSTTFLNKEESKNIFPDTITIGE